MNNKFGIEIECYVPSTFTHFSLASALNQNGFLGWEVKVDGSLHYLNNYTGVEIVSPPIHMNNATEIQIRNLSAYLDSIGAIVNVKCGLHVHVDASQYDADTMRAIFNRYKAFESEIDKWMPVSRRGNDNQFCRTLSQIDTVEGSINTLCSNINNGNRFLKVNLTAYLRHGTIEFRQHSGTTNSTKIINWVKFCLAFCNQTQADVELRSTSYTASILTQQEKHELVNSIYKTVQTAYSVREKYFIIERVYDMLNTIFQIDNFYGSFFDVMKTNGRLSYYTLKKYVAIINGMVEAHNQAFHNNVPANIRGDAGFYTPVDIIDKYTSFSFVKCNIEHYMNIYKLYRRTTWWATYNQDNIHDRLRPLMGSFSLATDFSGLFVGMDPDVIAYLRERAEDFGQSLAA